MRRRTKPRVVWLPNTNANSLPGNRSTWQIFDVQPGALTFGSSAVGEIPIVIDATSVDPLDAVSSLSDIENSGYRLRRVVGKIFCFADQDADRSLKVGVTAGLIIRRADPTTGLSYALSSADPTLLSPDDISNSGDPWIWKRNWILFNNLGQSGQTFSAGAGPTSNLEYGSVADGPHVDAKTARIVSSEERLFLDVSVTILDDTPSNAEGLVQIITDLRVLASMRTSSGNRRNASR